MQIWTKLAGLAVVTLLGGCLNNDLGRAGVGAAGGAVIADATGGNVLAGAAIGGAAGALCDDAGVCN
ncbi:hypothetical protein DDZ14_03295 [Maritimibacter sp. 55A14]|uniref:hypothetical protein n=1 Tax=Maritimibacter sp. 55A14 TaxID=2174844 RepID=UPI000D614A85|nr:hypothetical protein [Maritimibacter sp. 55A14]PWE33707.1 hypothetical protein DDZ14_03295 [Maritimibacter sp. 55A14]